jgi:hypothetical protein
VPSCARSASAIIVPESLHQQLGATFVSAPIADTSDFSAVRCFALRRAMMNGITLLRKQ